MIWFWWSQTSRQSTALSQFYDMFQAHLLSCIQQCVHRVKMIRLQIVNDETSDEEEEDDDAGEGGSGSGLAGLEEMLNLLTSRIIQTDMEDFELVRNDGVQGLW